MATFVIYTAKPNPAGPALYQTPVASGVSINDALPIPFGDGTVAKALQFLSINDRHGLQYSASSDGGTTFVRASDVGRSV